MQERIGTVLFAAVWAIAGCSGEPERSPEDQTLLDVKAYVTVQLAELHQAAADLQSAAPVPDADGWNETDDAEAVGSMRAAWTRARVAYERVEGAIAVLFPHLDVSTDERYDGFVEESPDDDPFDAEGVTGMHAIERILWAESHPPQVVAFESALPGYAPAAFPASEAQARAFRDGLVQRLVDDAATMRDDFAPLALDPATAFRGVIGSMEEQLEKISLASTGEDESRYAQHTLGDMRANLEGGRAIYGAFRDWLGRQEGGPAVDHEIARGFDAIEAAYAMHPGDAIPEVPPTWNPVMPSEADLGTGYGRLWLLLSREADPSEPGSLVSDMTVAGDRLGIPRLP